MAISGNGLGLLVMSLQQLGLNFGGHPGEAVLRIPSAG